MDKKTQSEGVYQDIAREELIAISNSLSDKDLKWKAGAEHLSTEDKRSANNVGVEKIISELISISYDCAPQGQLSRQD